MSVAPVKPFLITTDEQGEVHLTFREVRRNSQGYPWIRPTVVERSFDSVVAARKYASEHFGAKNGEFATK
jgi:hypothetical protein